jgi:hypothetical protein
MPGDHRELYNAALQDPRDAYERVERRAPGYFGADRAKMPVRYGTQSAQLQEIEQPVPRWPGGPSLPNRPLFAVSTRLSKRSSAG